MLSIGIDPVLASLGPFHIRWYGLMVAVAVTVGVYLAAREAKRRGIDEDEVYSVALWVVLAGVIGARLLHVVDNLSFYLSDPLAMLALQEGGLSIYGAILAGGLAGLIYVWRKRIPLGQFADAVAPALIVSQAIGRMGCLINGDAQGVATDLPWGLAYTHPSSLAPVLGVAGHPYPAYEILWDLFVFAVLWRLRDRLPVPSMLFLVYAALYSLGRFGLTFVRQEQVVLLGLQQAQVIALAVLVAAMLLLVYRAARLRPGHLAPGEIAS